MWVRCPVEQAFRAFVEPEELARFWLSNASARTEAGKTVEWRFMVAGATAETRVIEVVQNERIRFEWPDEATVVLAFESVDGGTSLTVELSDLGAASAEKIDAAFNLLSGFTIVLCDVKTLLEHGQSSNLVRDKAKLIALERDRAHR